MKKVIIVHGWSGSANADWIPWLKSELEKIDYEVLVPEMPDSDRPVIEKWVGCLVEAAGKPSKELYFIGHSIGCQAIMRYLDAHIFEPLETIGGAIFVAGWFNLENLENDEVEIAKPWLEQSINSVKIKTVLPKSTLIISDNDPYNAFDQNKQRFRDIGSKIVVLPGAGHITAEDGFIELPMVLSELNSFV
jgi:uncharacterized protein